MCIAVWAKEEEETSLSSLIESMSISDKVMFILYVANKYHHYYYDFPVNYLRNVCIRHITTSHFLFLDIDMWMTCTFSRGTFSFLADMYSHLLQLPSSILDDPIATVVIPPVFLKSKTVLKRCRNLQSCFME